MVDWIRGTMGLSTLQYQRLDDMVAAIGLPREQLCTYCWNGQSTGDA
jgi:amidophosphoribosyltransferase